MVSLLQSFALMSAKHHRLKVLDLYCGSSLVERNNYIEYTTADPVRMLKASFKGAAET